jgi:predicted ATP-grasp superfamily ATP-dependent carboligase
VSESRPAVVYGLLWAGLSLARALGRAGVRVTGIASDPNDFGLRSRYLAERHLTTEEDDERTLSLLRDAAGAGRPILFPERDENVHFVVRRWDEVRELADMPLPEDVETVLSLRRKDRLRVEAERVGLSIPATASPKDETELRKLDFPPPYLIKAVTGQEFAYAFGHKVFVADDADSAANFWRQAGERGFETVVQELIPNAYERIYSLFSYIGRDGRPLANVVGRKVRQGPLRFGTSAIFLVQPEPRVLELGLRLLESVGYRGFAQVEFAYDERDDEFKLLEVNTRPPMWAGVAMSRYFDIARIAYDDLSGRPPQAPQTFTDEVAWVYFAKDAWVGVQMMRARELSPRAFVAPYLRRRKVASTLAVDDPLPAVASLRYLRSKLA